MSDSAEKRERLQARVDEINDSDMSLNERRKAIKQAQNEIYDSDIEKMKSDLDQLEPKHSALVIGGLFLIGGIGGAIVTPQNPGGAFLLWGIIGAGIGFLIATETGREFAKAVSEAANEANQQQQQSSAASSKPKRICGNCGWQNPRDNNYCHDCGGELIT